MLLYVLDLWW